MSDATSLQILICIVRGWEKPGVGMIAHTRCDSVSECSGACSQSGAISAGRRFRTNSNDDDSYSRCFRPFEDVSSKDLCRLGCISNEWLLNVRTV